MNTGLLTASLLVTLAVHLMTRDGLASARLKRATRRASYRGPSAGATPGRASSPTAHDPTVALPEAPGARGQPGAQQRSRLICALAGIAAWLVVGGAAGALTGCAIAVAGPLFLSQLEGRSARERRVALENAAPMIAELLAACLASGATPAAALRAVSEAVGGPAAELLDRCLAQVQLGADPGRVWSSLATEPSLAPIARSIQRSADSGAPLADLLLRAADELRSQRRSSLEAAARSVGVKAVGPLGACFLPAFMLLAVVPLVASLIEQMIS